MPQPTSHLTLLPSGRQGDIAAGTTVLAAAQQLGVNIEAVCGGRQTCRKCLVCPEQSAALTLPEAAEQSYAAAHHVDLERYRMACAVQIVGDAVITVPEASLARQPVFRKVARDLTLEVAPALRCVCVQVERPALGSRADWQRLQAVLAEQQGLPDLRIGIACLRTLQAVLHDGDWTVTVTIWQDREVIRVEPGCVPHLYGLAVDLGSTTVVAYLCDLITGELLATEAIMNPQVRFGDDIMSRISSAAEPGGLQRLHHAIIKAVDDLAAGAAAKARIAADDIADLVVVGNSVMTHLFLAIDPRELGSLPFALASDEAIDLKARDLNLRRVQNDAYVHVLPSIAAYVGADMVGVLLAAAPVLTDAVTLIVDIGTNAEMVLAGRDFIVGSSSPTGPAFEGAQIKHGQRAAAGAIERFRLDAHSGQVRYKVVGDARWSDELPPGESLAPTGICGSGIIEIVAELFRAGLILPSGRLPPSNAHPRLRTSGASGEFIVAPAEESASGQAIVLTQTDIRAIQLAKAALYAGMRLLMQHEGIDHIDHIKLAGAFGSYIDPRYAMTIGMIPDCDLRQIETIGNAAGDGARMALLSVDQRRSAQTLARRVVYVETAAHPQFHDYFVEAMSLPHASDQFPHLTQVEG